MRLQSQNFRLVVLAKFGGACKCMQSMHGGVCCKVLAIMCSTTHELVHVFHYLDCSIPHKLKTRAQSHNFHLMGLAKFGVAWLPQVHQADTGFLYSRKHRWLMHIASPLQCKCKLMSAC